MQDIEFKWTKIYKYFRKLALALHKNYLSKLEQKTKPSLKKNMLRALLSDKINCRFERTERDEYSLTWPDVETKRYVTSLLSLMGLTLVSLLQ